MSKRDRETEDESNTNKKNNVLDVLDVLDVLVLKVDGTAEIVKTTMKDLHLIVGDTPELLPRDKTIYEENFDVYAAENGRYDKYINILGTECIHHFHVADNQGVYGNIVMVSVDNNGKETNISETISSGVLEWYKAINNDDDGNGENNSAED